MNVALAISIVAATLNLSAGAVLWALGRTPGWRSARTFGLIALTAGLYSAANALFCVPGLGDSTLLIVSRFTYFSATLHTLGWLVFAFGGQDASVAALPRSLQRLVFGVFGVAVLLFLTGAHLDGTVSVVDTGVSDVRYNYPNPTLIGDVYGLAVALLLLLPTVRLALRYWRGERHLLWQLLGFAIFLATAVLETLVASRIVRFISPADIGFIAVVLPMSVAQLRRFSAEATRIYTLSGKLADEVQVRTRERDLAEHALVETERLAALGRLAAGVGHEVNNPLTYLVLSLQELRDYFAGHDPGPEAREALDNAKDATDRIRKVVEGLHAYSRQREPRGIVLLGAIVRDALKVAGPQLRATGIEVGDEGCPPILGDASRLVQAVVNLMVNAAHAVENNDRPPRILVRSGRAASGDALLTVSDNGRGIRPADLKRLAEPYFTTRASNGGLGLGLFVTRGIVDAHGGRLEFESTLGEGTVVRMFLPAAVVAEVDAAPGPTTPTPSLPAKPTSKETAPGERPRLLLIDDEALVLKTVSRALTPKWDVSVAMTGDEALDLVAAQRFAAVLCDLTLPGMSGVTFAERLAVNHPELRARTLFITGGALNATTSRFLERADVRWLPKPLDVVEVDQLLSSLVAEPPATGR